MNALVFLTLRPSNVLLDFIDSIKDQYKVYLCIDDNEYECDRDINIIKLDDKVCKNCNYFNLNYMIKSISAWDKALLYFTIVNKYDNVWFIEDDVYLDSIDTIKELDKIEADLISPPVVKSNWLWIHHRKAKKYFTTQRYRGMMCVCRLSRNILDDIENFVLVKKSLCFLEILFPTIAKQNDRKIANPDKLKNIKYRKSWKKVEKGFLYHPVKNHNIQREFRCVNL